MCFIVAYNINLDMCVIKLFNVRFIVAYNINLDMCVIKLFNVFYSNL